MIELQDRSLKQSDRRLILTYLVPHKIKLGILPVRHCRKVLLDTVQCNKLLKNIITALELHDLIALMKNLLPKVVSKS